MVIAIVFLGCAILYAGYRIASSVDRFTESCAEDDSITMTGAEMATDYSSVTMPGAGMIAET